MKKSLAYLWALLLPACSSLEPSGPVTDEISFRISGAQTAQTRAMVERVSVSGFNCMATRADDNSTFIGNVITSGDGHDEVLSGHYWPTAGALSFFGVLPAVNMTNSNGTVSFQVGTSSARLDGSEDYVFASTRNVSRSGSPVPLTFNHILSNISGVRASGGCEGVTTTISSICISRPGYGTYLCSEEGVSWTGLGPEEKTYLSTSFISPSHPSGSADISGTETGASADNISIIPGTWDIRIRYSVTSGGITEEYDRHGSAQFPAGKKNTICITFSSDFRKMTVSTTAVPWTEGNGAGSWTEEFRMPRKLVLDTNGGEWYKDSNPLATNAGDYEDYVYRNVNTGSTRSYKTLTITIKGYDVFHFRMFVPYTASIERSVLISSPDDNLLSRLPAVSGASGSTIRTIYGKNGEFGKAAYNTDSQANLEEAYQDYCFTGLDPGLTYSIQVIAVNCGGRAGGLESYILIPKAQGSESVVKTISAGNGATEHAAESWGRPFVAPFHKVFHSGTSVSGSLRTVEYDFLISGYSSFTGYFYNTKYSTYYAFCKEAEDAMKSINVIRQGTNGPGTPVLSSNGDPGSYEKVTFEGLNPFKQYRIEITVTLNGEDPMGWFCIPEQ